MNDSTEEATKVAKSLESKPVIYFILINAIWLLVQ